METFSLALTHDEIVSLGRAVDAWARNINPLRMSSDEVTTMGNLISLTDKLPDESILDGMEEPDELLSEQDVDDLEGMAQAVLELLISMGAEGVKVRVADMGKETE